MFVSNQISLRVDFKTKTFSILHADQDYSHIQREEFWQAGNFTHAFLYNTFKFSNGVDI